MVYGSLAMAPTTCIGGPAYFFKEAQDTLENSPTYMGATDIENRLPQIERDLARCFPRNEKIPVIHESCVAQAKGYDDLQNKLTALTNDPEYTATVKRAETMFSHGKNSIYFSLLFLIPYFVGRRAYYNRTKEEASARKTTLGKGEQ